MNKTFPFEAANVSSVSSAHLKVSGEVWVKPGKVANTEWLQTLNEEAKRFSVKGHSETACTIFKKLNQHSKK